MTLMNETPFKTLAQVGHSETVVERSRFLGCAVPVGSLEDALEHVAAHKTEHYNARHVCYGLRIGRGAQGIDRSNDDGEPARTGGFPLWQLLDGEEVIDAVVIVVRYYGGVKLGTGGLARAYREAGRLALQEAGILTVHPEVHFPLVIPYDMHGKVEHALKDVEAVRTSDTIYSDKVTLNLAVRSAHLEEVRALLSGLLQRSPGQIGEGVG